jgi:hypothetical protein
LREEIQKLMNTESVAISVEREDVELAEPGETPVQLENVPSVEDIRLLAYQKYIERGGTDGGDLDDWLLAERELVETAKASTISEDDCVRMESTYAEYAESQG